MSTTKQELLEAGLPPKKASWEKKVEASWKILRERFPETEKWTRFNIRTTALNNINILPFGSTTNPSRHLQTGERCYAPTEFPLCCGIGYIQAWRCGPTDLHRDRLRIPLIQQAAFILWMDTMKRFCLYGLIIASVAETTYPAVAPLLEYCGWTRGGAGINHVHDFRACAIWCFVVHDKQKELEKWQ